MKTTHEHGSLLPLAMVAGAGLTGAVAGWYLGGWFLIIVLAVWLVALFAVNW